MSHELFAHYVLDTGLHRHDSKALKLTFYEFIKLMIDKKIGRNAIVAIRENNK
jgi:hypothetical protein